MWEFFWPDIAINFGKGLLAGGVSIALQALVPRILGALKRLRARWFARQVGGKRSAEKRQSFERRSRRASIGRMRR